MLYNNIHLKAKLNLIIFATVDTNANESIKV